MAEAERPHLLYVAWGFPPSRGAGMYRALATANAFVAADWDVTVLTATRETFEALTGTDDASLERIDPRVVVERVPFDVSTRESDLRKWSRGRIYSPLLWNYLASKRAATGFPEPTYGPWGPALVARALDLHRRHPVSLVIGSANPNVDFAPGWALHKRFGVPFVMDHRDAWHLDVYTGDHVGSRTSRSAVLERRMIAQAEETWFVNEPIRQWHAREHPARAERMHVVANGFDADFLNGLSSDRDPALRSELTFGYLGTIYGPMPLQETLEAWRIARSRNAVISRSRLMFRGRLGHFSTPDSDAAELISHYAAHGVSYEGPVSKTEVATAYNGYDILCLMIAESPFVTSGKVFEYAATGLPIASLHSPRTAASAVLRGRPLWYPAADTTAESFADALCAAADAFAELTPADIEEARAWSMPLARDEQLTPRIAALRERLERLQ